MIYFLTLNEVLAVHDLLLVSFGGLAGVRSYELLISAIAQPSTGFSGRYLHVGVFAMASAYAYHIIKNHPFVDGNKRTGMFVAVNFLERNGYPVTFSQDDFYKVALDVATSKLSKEKLAKIFEKAVIVKQEVL